MDDKIKVLITSVLKPADDVRSCYKIGQSLAQTNKYEVNIIGFDSKKKSDIKNILLYPIFNFQRNSIKRIFAPILILKKYLQLKPQLIIVNTPELLWVISIIKIIFGTKFIYDIQENYLFNIRQNQIYSGFNKLVALGYIKLNEKIAQHLADGFFLAEGSYEQQLQFIHNRPYIKLLNKTALELNSDYKSIKYSMNDAIKFVYSGTIGAEYGTLEAIKFCEKLHQSNKKITLIIIGYSPDYKYFKEVKNLVTNKPYIQLKTDNKPIPQSQIIAEIKKSDIALLPYQLNPNISLRFPTKIYDYLALQKPMIIPPNQTWKAYLDQYKAGICVDFLNPDMQTFLQQLSETEFYFKIPKEEIQWKSQESKLKEFIDKLLSK